MTTCAMLFPGQGSQSQAMLADFAKQFPHVIACFAEASIALGYDLWQLVQDNPDDKLNQTEYTQPALLTASVAVWQVWCQLTDYRPATLAGHSLGEYAALVCSGVLSLTDAVQVVAARGRYMQQAVPAGQGAMAAVIGLDDQQVIALCQRYAENDILSPANFNSNGQVVIAGDVAAVKRVIDNAKAAGARMAQLLPVSVPSHCLLMKPAAQQLQADLTTVVFNKPTIPVINNVDVVSETEPQAIRDALVRQLYQPVRWCELIQRIQQANSTRPTTFIECGPGKVLTGLNRRIDKQLPLFAVPARDTIEACINQLTEKVY